MQAFEKAVSPQAVVTTAEGIEIQVGRAAENCLFSEAKQTANNAQKVEYAQELAIKAFHEATTAEAIATTAEGIQVRAAAAAEQCVLSEVQETVKGSKVIESIQDIAKKSQSFIQEKKAFNFTKVTGSRMADINRTMPVQILREIITNPIQAIKDPQGTSALMYYAQLWKNGKLYNAEVLYDSASNTILHFLYSRESLGPLAKVK